METELHSNSQPFLYFTGRHGNLHDIPRKGCEWYDERDGRWHKCHEDIRHGDPKTLFLPEVKYRTKNIQLTKEQQDN